MDKWSVISWGAVILGMAGLVYFGLNSNQDLMTVSAMSFAWGMGVKIGRDLK